MPRGGRSLSRLMSSLVSHSTSFPAGERLGSVRLRSADGSTEAEFVPQANMVCSSLRYHGVEYLHQGSGVEAYARGGTTMGIPLLHPWANRLSGFHYQAAGSQVALPRGENLIPLDDIGLPIHGVMPGLMRWDAARTAPMALTARLSWRSGKQLSVFPFPHKLTIDANLDRGALTIATTLTAIGEQKVPVSFGYHPYLRIPDENRSTWQVALGARERLLLDEAMIPTGRRVPVARRRFALANQSLDDGFDALDRHPSFEAVAGDIAIRVEFLDGYPYAQVYAPADGPYICFEPMTAPTNALVSGDGLSLVAGKAPYRAVFRVAISGVALSHN